MRKRTLSWLGIFMVLLLSAGGCSKSKEEAIPPGPYKNLNTSTVNVTNGVGPLKFGMTKKEVLQLLGPPDLENKEAGSKAMSFYYKNQGIRVGMDPKGRVATIILDKNFRGKTIHGVGIGSRKEDVLKAYGKPTQTRQMFNVEVLEYHQIGKGGVSFFIKNGKVHEIIIGGIVR